MVDPDGAIERLHRAAPPPPAEAQHSSCCDQQRQRPAHHRSGLHRRSRPAMATHAGAAQPWHAARRLAGPCARSCTRPPIVSAGLRRTARATATRGPCPEVRGPVHTSTRGEADWGHRSRTEGLRKAQGRSETSDGGAILRMHRPPGPGPASLAGSSPVTHPSGGGPGQFADQGLHPFRRRPRRQSGLEGHGGCASCRWSGGPAAGSPGAPVARSPRHCPPICPQ
jgi:hypothetical protein